MDSIQISSGARRIAINDDPERVIEFNPEDVNFAERFYQLYRDFEAQQAEYRRRADQLDAESNADENGLPSNLVEGLAFVREVCTFLRQKIDFLFGEGASQKAFGETMSLEMIGQFFEGITPFIERARAEKVAKYTRKSKRVMR